MDLNRGAKCIHRVRVSLCEHTDRELVHQFRSKRASTTKPGQTEDVRGRRQIARGTNFS
jgi:hypothetical protein